MRFTEESNSAGIKGPIDWLFSDVPMELSKLSMKWEEEIWAKCDDQEYAQGTIINGWNISHEYENTEDIPHLPGRSSLEHWIPSYIENDYHAATLGGREENEYYSKLLRSASKRYGRIKVNGRWVYSIAEKMRDNCYKYFYHYQYKGPKKPRDQSLWPHNVLSPANTPETA